MHLLKDFASFIQNERLDKWAFSWLGDISKIDLIEDKDHDEVIANIEEGLSIKLELFKTVEIEHIGAEIFSWPIDQLTGLLNDVVQCNDLITLFSTQKTSLMNFVPDFTKDVTEGIQIVRQIEQAYSILQKQVVQTAFKSKKESEAEIQTSEKQLEIKNRELHESQHIAQIGSWEWDLNSDRVTWSEELFKIYGIIPKEKGLNFNEFITAVHPEDREQVSKTVNEAVLSGGSFTHFHRINKNGEERILHGRGEAVLDETGSVKLMRGTCQDVTKQQLTEANLSESQHFIKHIGEYSPYFIYVYDLKKRTYAYINRAAYSLFGYTREEILSMGDQVLMQTVHPEDLAKIPSEIEMLLKAKEGEFIESERRVKHKNGEYKYMYTRSTLFKRDEHGNPWQTIGLSLDVTEKRQSELFLKSVLDSSSNGIQAYKSVRNDKGEIVDFKCVLFNPASELFTGYNKEEVLKTTMLQIRPEVATNGLFQEYIDLVEGKIKIVEKDYLMRRTNTWVHLIVVKNEDGFFLTFTDITAQKKASEEIKKSENLYRTLAKNIPNTVVLLLDKDMQISLADGTIWNDDEFPRNEIIGKHLSSYFPKKIADEYEPMYRSALDGEVFEFESYFMNKWFKVNIMGVKNNDGEIFASMSVTQEISKIKEYQKQLEQQVSLLNRSNEELERFAYVASHDLNEPLRKINMFGGRLKENLSGKLDEDSSDYLERMLGASRRMQSLIDDILSFSRISRPGEVFEKVNLSTLIDEIKDELEITIEQKSATIEYSDLPEIDGVKTQVRQLLQNIISNGLKFNKSTAPSIKISAETISGSELGETDKMQAGKRFCKLSIQDNGIGFEEKYLERIFIVFQRLHGNSDYKGTGIGLAICKKIADNHGGQITAKSKLDAGSTFIVTLPLIQERKMI